MERNRNKLITHSSASNEISHKSRFIQSYSVTNRPNAIVKNSPSSRYIKNTCKKYRKNSSLRPINIIFIDLMHKELPGTDTGIFISEPVKEVNPNTLIQDITAQACHSHIDYYEITIDHFYLATISYVIDYYRDSEIQFVLTNQGLIISMLDDSDIAKYLYKNSNGKIRIICYCMQDETSIDDPTIDPYLKIPICSNNFEKLSQFFRLYWRFENLEITKYFIKAYPNSYIYDFLLVDRTSLIDLTYIKHFTDSGSKILEASDAIYYNDI